MVRAVLSQASLVELKDARAVIACPARYATGARHRLAEIAGVFEKELGRKVDVVIEDPSGQTESGAVASSAEPASAEAAASPAAGNAVAPPAANPLDDPLVKTAIELFSARIVSVSRRPQ